jgi:large subunit ribosomal protein L35
MAKLKTHRGAAKRFRRTASGKLKHKQPFHSHLLTGKGRKRKRQLKKPALLTVTEAGRLKKLLPYL